MKLVINIPEGLKQKIDEGFTSQVITSKLWDAVKNGTPLPKGHGRLIDADALENYIREDADEWDEYALAYFENAPTIIEADKESGK